MLSSFEDGASRPRQQSLLSSTSMHASGYTNSRIAPTSTSHASLSELPRCRCALTTPRVACGKGSIERMLYQFLPAWVNNTHWFGRYIQFSVTSTSTNQFTVHSSSSPATCDVSCIRVLFRRFSTYRFTRPVETTERRVPTSRPVLPGCIIPLHVVDGPSLRLGPFPSSPSDP